MPLGSGQRGGPRAMRLRCLGREEEGTDAIHIEPASAAQDCTGLHNWYTAGFNSQNISFQVKVEIQNLKPAPSHIASTC